VAVAAGCGGGSATRYCDVCYNFKRRALAAAAAAVIQAHAACRQPEADPHLSVDIQSVKSCIKRLAQHVERRTPSRLQQRRQTALRAKVQRPLRAVD
jgi:hypothetical protein